MYSSQLSALSPLALHSSQPSRARHSRRACSIFDKKAPWKRWAEASAHILGAETTSAAEAAPEEIDIQPAKKTAVRNRQIVLFINISLLFASALRFMGSSMTLAWHFIYKCQYLTITIYAKIRFAICKIESAFIYFIVSLAKSAGVVYNETNIRGGAEHGI